MKFLEKHPMIMIVVGVMGISLSSIFIRYSPAPSAVTATWRLLWTIILQSPVILLNTQFRQEIAAAGRKNVLMSSLSGLFLAIHFAREKEPYGDCRG